MIFFDGPSDEKWFKAVFKNKGCIKPYFENHWKCMNKHGGHAILLGIQYTRGRAYNVMAYEFCIDVCILGFAFGIKIL